mgnify:CR=1 FL=1
MNQQIVRALVLSGALLAGSVAFTVAKRMDLLDGETTQRGLMVVVMLVYANDIPKTVLKKTARGQALQRASARALVLGYLAWVAAWVFAPIDLANTLAMIPIALAAGWMALACVLSRRPAV